MKQDANEERKYSMGNAKLETDWSTLNEHLFNNHIAFNDWYGNGSESGFAFNMSCHARHFTLRDLEC